MQRFALGFFGCITLAVSAAALSAACSGDAKSSDADRSSDNAGAGTDISASDTGSGGSSSGLGGSATAGPTYTAARACEVFARASCNKGVECGLVLTQIASQLVCVQCDALSLGIIEQQCQQDSPGDKDAAAVDRCVASITAQPCAQACSNLDVSDCAVFGDLPTDSTRDLVCDPRCVNAG
jgi:hypothetical protein